MPSIITIAHMKGGVGKSTIAFNLIYTFAESLNIAVLDIDLQASITQLLQQNDNITLLPMPNDLQALRQINADILIIDTPGYLSAQIPSILSLSNLVIIPTKSGFWDFYALNSMKILIQQALKTNANLKWSILNTMINPQAKLSHEMNSLMEDDELPFFKTQISQRVSYVRSLITGGILKSNDLKAKYEIISLADEIINLLQT